MNDTIRKFTVGLVGLAMVASLVPVVPSAYATTPTIEELQAQIAALTAQLAALQAAQPVTPVVGIEGVPAGFTFARTLRAGMSGEDVRNLQRVLNANPATRVAETGAGSPGNETTVFGPRTRAAVIRFQELHRAEVLTPAGLVAGTGLVGPRTMARLNVLVAGEAPVVPGVPVVPVVPVVAPGLTVGLAADTPAPAVIIAGQALAELARFTFTNGDTTEVRVTDLTLARTGVSSDATLSAVYLYDGMTRLTDLATVSAGRITFVNTAGIFTIPAGGSRTISVRSNITDGVGQTVGVAVLAAADVRTNATALAGVFPLRGNLMNVATAVLTTVGVGITGIGPVTISAGSLDQTVWRSDLTVGLRPVDLRSLQLRQVGSIVTDDIRNFRLFVRGIEVSRATLARDNTLTFDLSASPARLITGTVALEVRADVVAGSGRTFTFALWRAIDLDVVDSEFRVNILATGAFPVSTGLQTIGTGTLTMVRAADSPTTAVVRDGVNVPLARYTLTAFGESIRIERLAVALTSTVGLFSATNTVTLRNGRLLANGVQVGSTAGIVADSGTVYELGAALTVVPGTPVTLEVRADIFDSEGGNEIAADQAFTVRLLTGSNNAQALGSLSLMNVPAANADANSLTIHTGALVVAANTAFGAQNVVAGTNDVKIGSFVLQTGPAETVNINNYRVAIGGTAGHANLSNLRISDVALVRGTVSATNDFSVTQTMAPNTTRIVDVFVNIASGATGTVIPTLTVTAVGAVTGNPIVSAAITGQTMTITTGSLTMIRDVSTPDAAIVIGGTTVPVVRYRFDAVNEGFTIDEARITITTPRAVTGVRIGAVTVTPVDGVAVFTGNLLPVPRDGNAILTVEAVFNTVAAGFAGSGDSPIFTLTSYRATSASGLVVTATPALPSNTMVLRRTVPTVTLNPAILSNVLGGIDHEVLRINVAANASEDVDIREIRVTPTISGTITGGNGLALFQGTTLRGRVMNVGETIATPPISVTGLSTLTVSAGAIVRYQIGQRVTLAAADIPTVTVAITAIADTSITFTPVIGTDTATATAASMTITPAGFTTGLTYRIPVTIGAAVVSRGTTAAFSVHADTAGLTTVGNSIQMRVLADTASGAIGNLIWREGTIAPDINGHLVRDLPITGPALIR